DSPLLGVNTPRSDEDRLKLMELMVFLLQKCVYVEIGITVARLSSYCCQKSDVAEGFEQIIDFLSGSYIHYALTVNPHIYISCIKQFWNTASVKRSDDAEGVVCLPNDEIFIGLAQMGYEKPSTKLTFYKAFFSSQWKFLIHTILQYLSAKRTSWNEFSTTMASAVICLSKGQRFNFSKYIFDSLVRTHSTCFISPALTQKVFANMRRVGKGFSRVETPLFEGMLVARQPAEEGLVAEQVQVDDVIAAAVEEDAAKDVAHDAIPSPPPHAIPYPSQEPSSPPQQPQSFPQAPPQEVVTAAASQVSAASATIPAAAPTDEFNKDIDWDAAMDHVNQKSNNPQYIKRYQGMKKRPQTESEARKNMIIYLKNTTGYKMDFFKGMTYAQICPIFQARFDENISAFNVSEDTFNRFKVRGFGNLLEAGIKADTKHDIGPTCL
nr:hypothetical protein [Tanacetum cinerariifolium]